MTLRLVASVLLITIALPSSAIPVRVEPKLAGSVVLEAGQPLAGARIELIRYPSFYRAGRLWLDGIVDPPPVAVAEVGANGRFLLRAPETGVWIVVAKAPGRVPMQLAPLVSAEDLELAPVFLPPDVGTKVRILDARGQPLIGAWVQARGSTEAATASSNNAWSPVPRRARTGEDGRAELPRIANETLDLAILTLRGGEVRFRGAGATAEIRESESPFETRTLRLRDRKGKPAQGVVVFRSERAWPIGITDQAGSIAVPIWQGRAALFHLAREAGQIQTYEVPARFNADGEIEILIDDPVELVGKIQDRTSRSALGGALVWPRQDPGSFVRTQPAGTFRFIAPEPAQLTLQVEASGYLPQGISVGEPELRARRLPTTGLERATALAGRAVDPQGRPIVAAYLEATPEAALGRPSAVASARRGTSGSGGAFELRGLRIGEVYEVMATKPGYSATPVRVPALAPPSSPLRIVLPPARSAQGEVRDMAGKPIGDAEVRLRRSGLPDRRRSADEASGGIDPFRAQTDAQGRYRLPALPADTIDLAVRKEGFSPTFAKGLRVPETGNPAQLGVVVLRPGARLAGRVVDRIGRGVTGAAVYRVEQIGSLDQLEAEIRQRKPEASTGGDGAFAIEDLPRGEPIHLVVSARGYLPSTIRGVRPPTPRPVVVTLSPGASVRGRVIDDEGRPVRGANLQLEWYETLPEDERIRVGAPLVRSARSNREGRFELADCPQGTGEIGVFARGYVTPDPLRVSIPQSPEDELTVVVGRGATLAGRVTTTTGDPVSGTRVVIDDAVAATDDEGRYLAGGVRPGPAEIEIRHPSYPRRVEHYLVEPGANVLDIELEAARRVRGRVVNDRREPVIGAAIHLTTNAESRNRREHRTRSASDGTFELYPVPRDTYAVEASADGYALTEQKELVVEAEDLVGVEIVLERGAAIVGRILGLPREDLAGLEVRAESDDPAGANWPAMSARIDAEGRFEIRNLIPGQWLVKALLPARQREVQARVPLRSGEEVARDLEFGQRLALSGRVFYLDEPLSDAKISVRGRDRAIERSVVTDYLGEFRIDELEPDTYWLGISHSRKRLIHNDSVRLVVNRDLEIRLQAAVVSGLVFGAAGRAPVAGALVALRPTEGEEFLIADSSDRSGTFRISRVPAGRYRLSVTADGFGPAETTVEVQVGRDLAGVEVPLERTRGLELRVRTVSGRIPPAIDLRAIDPGGTAILAERRNPDAEGKVSLASLPPGSWNLQLSAPGAGLARVAVTVPGEPLSLVLEDAGNLLIRISDLASSDFLATGSVFDSQGQPFQALDPGGLLRSAWSLAGGHGSIENLPAGVWRLHVATSDGRVWDREVITRGVDQEVSID